MVRAAVLVVIDNVARFYFESPQEEWHLARHFPNIAPPWPKAFYEFRVPRLINLGKKLQPYEAADARVGLPVYSDSVDEVLAGRRARRGDGPLRPHERQELVDHFGPYADSLVWGTADQDVYQRLDVGWLCYAMVIFEPLHREPRVLNSAYSAVTPQGEIVCPADGEPVLVVTVPPETDRAGVVLSPPQRSSKPRYSPDAFRPPSRADVQRAQTSRLSCVNPLGDHHVRGPPSGRLRDNPVGTVGQMIQHGFPRIGPPNKNDPGSVQGPGALPKTIRQRVTNSLDTRTRAGIVESHGRRRF